MPGKEASNRKSGTKRKMQDVSFSDIEDFLAYLPEDELKIVKLLRKIIFSCIPEIEEKLNYNVPYYKRHSNICFIWLSSVKWHGIDRTGVRIGFNKGYLMQDEINWLDKDSR